MERNKNLFFLKLLILSSVVTLVCSEENGNKDSPVLDKSIIMKKIKQAGNKEDPKKLIDNPKCSDDLTKLCQKKSKQIDNLSVLNCIQNQQRDLSALLNEECQNIIWLYKYNLTKSSYIENILKKMCRGDPAIMTDCADSTNEYNGFGNMLSCIIESFDSISKLQCRQVVIQLASIVFSDYHLVKPVTDNCKVDIQRLQCGRVQTFNNSGLHSQGQTIECLSKEMKSLGKECQHQILRITELQSEDFHLDRALYFACRDDREQFCSTVKAGRGKVYQCLMNHQNDRTMSVMCSQQLKRRESLIALDYRVSRTLVSACKTSIKENKCRKGTIHEDTSTKLSMILVCLQGALRNGAIENGICKKEIIAHRRILLNISPKIVTNCKSELDQSCANADSDKKLHCLMKLVRAKRKAPETLVSLECQRALEEVVKETDIAEDWRVDPVLYEACLPVVQSRCKHIKDGKGRIMRCLMSNIDHSDMIDGCKYTLLEIMYFVSRDWKLDPQLYAACKEDSVRFCNADPDWTENTKAGPNNNILVLPCLFRNAYKPTSIVVQGYPAKGKLKRLCSAEVRRVMYERSSYVSLHPRIEMECMSYLATFCSHQINPGEEMFCLQEHLDQLAGNCHSLISNYTVAEVKDIELNSLIKNHCSEVLDQICNNLPSSEEDDGGVMDCLIEQKNSKIMTEKYKCRAVVEKFQLVMMKDIQFNIGFKDPCQKAVKMFCQFSPRSDASVKARIDCLANVLMNDELNNKPASMPRECILQLRKFLRQRHESVNIDSELQTACNDEIKQYCVMEPGEGKILECLRTKKLGSACKAVMFKRKREESSDPLTDIVLIRNCRRMINRFCNVPSDQIFKCLKDERDNSDFDLKCRAVVSNRMLERSKDYRLNPFLMRACRPDMRKYCQKLLETSPTEERNGKVIDCLKKKLMQKKLTNVCELRMIRLTKTAALNYKLDPVLVAKCARDLKEVCLDEQANAAEKGEVEECLKMKLEHSKLTEECSIHMSEIIALEKVDIHADPLLYSVCAIDDNKLCMERERGTHLACLYDNMKRHPESLSAECHEMLKNRIEMFKMAKQISNPESLKDIVDSVRISPHRNYFMIILLTVIGVIFLSGITCGRFTRRTKAFMKNR